MKRTLFKRLLWIVLIAVGVTAVFQFSSVWLKYHLLYGSEQQLVKLISTDGEQAAYFSVKYEGTTSWWPANPKPHFYITVTEVESGKLLLRETDFDWPKTKPYRSTSDSFTNLSRTYAPWAESHFQPDVPHPTSSNP